MNNIITICLVALLGIFSGCDGRPPGVPPEFSRKTGDLAAFFVTTAKSYGGRASTTNSLSKVDSVWWFNSDKNGFQVVTEKTNLPPFLKALEEAYGSSISITGSYQLLYNTTNAGVRIACNPNFATNYIHVICLKAGAY